MTYQRMMNKVFQEEIRETLKVYMDDMVLKFNQEKSHDQHLNQVFKKVWKYNMRINPKKCTFRVRADKFLGFHLRELGI